ncbi:MAG: hypothetical protein KBA28_09290 [Syntrophaceae bacterium]|jgi:hypothetical protein|nr:hypothetical protein [Syntrophaceae bacterium]
MKKLDKRQMIILAVAALCALYAAYEFLIARPAADKAKQQVATVAESFDINTLTGDMAVYKPSGVDLYIEEKAEMEWGKSPFWEKTAYQEFVGREASGIETAAVKIIYSGYIDSGRKKIAVLNGAEYGAGEPLEMLEGYILKSVTTDKVVVYNRKTGAELEVPIQE